MGRRFAIVIGVAAAGVMALGATAAAADTQIWADSGSSAWVPEVVKYDTKLTVTKDGGPNYHGRVKSDRDRNLEYDPANAVRKCMEGRRVILFKKRPGADRRLAAVRSHFKPEIGHGTWWVILENGVDSRRVYGEVRRKVRDRYVCRADRSAFRRT